MTQAENLWERLEAGGIDMIVDAEPKTSDQYFSQVIYQERFGLFCANKSIYLPDMDMLPFSFAKHAYDRNGEFIEGHLRKLKIPFHLHYNVGSFTMCRIFVKADLCIGVLPLTLAKSSEVKPFLWKGKVHHFGEHRICATIHESVKLNGI